MCRVSFRIFSKEGGVFFVVTGLYISYVQSKSSRKPKYLFDEGADFCTLGGANSPKRKGNSRSQLKEENEKDPSSCTDRDRKYCQFKSQLDHLKDQESQIRIMEKVKKIHDLSTIEEKTDEEKTDSNSKKKSNKRKNDL